MEYRRSLRGSAVLIGLLENTGNFYQRRKEALAEAQKNPNMRKIVENLRKIKNLRSNEPVLTPPDTYIICPNTKAIFVKGRELDQEHIANNAQLADPFAKKQIAEGDQK